VTANLKWVIVIVAIDNVTGASVTTTDPRRIEASLGKTQNVTAASQSTGIPGPMSKFDCGFIGIDHS
jgi:hypothetical protein